MPRVSVVVPAFNASATIAAALGSVAAQTYRDWEVVVADDASTDGTADVAAAAPGRARVVRLERNAGPATARNAALREATGELVAFLDADDVLLPAYLERQVARYDAERARPLAPVGIVACDARLADGASYLAQFGRFPVEPITLERVLRRNTIYVSALVPRAAGDAVGWFDESLRVTEDHGLWIKLLERGHRAVLNREVLAEYRRTDASLSRDIVRQADGNRRNLEAALARGALDERLRRIARQELRYNRALAAVAAAASGAGARRLLRDAPVVAWVAATRPGHWGDWLRALRAR